MPEREPNFEPESTPELDPYFLQQQIRLPKEQWDERFRQLIDKETIENQKAIRGEPEVHSESPETYLRSTFERYIKGLDVTEDDVKDKRILDLGSGDGEFVESLIKKGITKEAYGLDANLDNIAIKPELKEHFFKGTFEDTLPLQNLDYIVSVGAVSNAVWNSEKLQDIEGIIKNAIASLKKDGQMRIYPMRELPEDSTLEEFKESNEIWNGLLEKLQQEHVIEYHIEPRDIRVTGNNNDIFLQCVLIIKKHPEARLVQLEKEQQWEKVSKEVNEVTDGLGLEIDEGIKETVVACMVNGLNTSQSCEGHTDRALPVPWVEIEALNEPKEHYVGQNEIYEKVAKKYNLSAEAITPPTEHVDIFEEANFDL